MSIIPFLRSEEKAICVPSGDHTGNVLPDEPNVSCDRAPCFRSYTHRAELGCPISTASCCPSGESCNVWYLPTSVTEPACFPKRSNQSSLLPELGLIGENARTAFCDAAKMLSHQPESVSTFSAAGEASPVSSRWRRSNGCAMSVDSRTYKR